MTNVLPLKPKTIEDYLLVPDVHDVCRAPRGGFVTGIVAAVALLLEWGILYAVLENNVHWVVGVVAHGIIAGALFFYAKRVRASTRENRFAWLLVIAVAAAGPYGAAGAVLTVLLSWLFGLGAHPFKEWYGSMFPRLRMTEAERIYTDLKIGRDESEKIYSVIPFLDVLTLGNEAQKRQALAKMTSNFHPSFAPVFKKALGDASNTIRVQAATGVTKIEHQFIRRQMELSAVAVLHPDDPVVLLALARHYDDYAYTGLLDGNREAMNRQSALGYYKQYLTHRPDDVGVRGHVGRILMRDRNYKEAAEWLKSSIDSGHSSPAMGQWYAEALFACGRYDDLRHYVHRMPPATDEAASFQPSLMQAVALWKTAGGRA